MQPEQFKSQLFILNNLLFRNTFPPPQTALAVIYSATANHKLLLLHSATQSQLLHSYILPYNTIATLFFISHLNGLLFFLISYFSLPKTVVSVCPLLTLHLPTNSNTVSPLFFSFLTSTVYSSFSFLLSRKFARGLFTPALYTLNLSISNFCVKFDKFFLKNITQVLKTLYFPRLSLKNFSLHFRQFKLQPILQTNYQNTKKEIEHLRQSLNLKIYQLLIFT